MRTNFNYKDFARLNFESVDWFRDDVNRELEGKIIINVETKKDFIRVWFKED